jgi:23S rRNA pseudouridine2605 synthase
LIRIAYGPFQLGNLGRGELAEVSAKVMREQLGKGPGG